MLNRIESERKFKIFFHKETQFEWKSIFAKLGWQVTSQTKELITGQTAASLFSWGDTITIVLEKDKLLFNSRPQGRQSFTFNRDKINYKKLCGALLTNTL